MMNHPYRWGVSIAALALLLLSGAGWASAHATPHAGLSPKSGGTLMVGVDSDFVTLNPSMSSALIDRQIFINVFNSL